MTIYNIIFALVLVRCTASSVYYFGTQSILCVMMTDTTPQFGVSLGTSASSRFRYSPWHRLVKYKNYIIEWGMDKYSINYRYPHSRGCHVTWEQRPAGRSSKSINEVDNFGRMYEHYNGGYGILSNNCHMFANDLSRFLTYNTHPNYCGVFISASSTCPTENINAFTSTYSHFKGYTNNCNYYRRKQIRFRNNYCGNMDTPVFSATTTAPITTTVGARGDTTLSVMDLARSMAREREEMMRRGQK